MGSKNGKGDVVEGFRVLTLRYRTNELPPEAFERLKELFEKYRAIASLYFWALQNGKKDVAELALRRAEEELPYYWRLVFDSRSPLYLFNEVKEMPRPRKHVLKLPLVTALHYHSGAYIDEDKSELVVRLGGGQRLELPVPERALKRLKEKESEVTPLKPSKTVRIQWRPERTQMLKVQIVLRVERPRPPRPDPREALLVFIDANSRYGFAVVFAAYDSQYVKVYETPKFRPPSRGKRMRESAKRKSAASHGVKTNINFALARLTEEFDSRGWVEATIAQILKKALIYAEGRSIWVNFDSPPIHILRGRLRQTLLSARRILENLCRWYGIYATFRCYSSHHCPICEGRLEEHMTRRTRIMRCRCGFADDRDFVPFHRWITSLGLPLPKWPLYSHPRDGQ